MLSSTDAMFQDYAMFSICV